ncbi:MAG: hypothetical protein AB9834_09875 [Lentimicrobium sp.]
MNIPRINRLSTTSRLLQSKYYAPAHSGDYEAALQLVDSLNLDFDRFSQFTGYVCPVQKLTGNQIPVALAYRIADHSNLSVNNGIYLLNIKSGNTMAERMLFAAEYAGHVILGNYIIVDDVFTTGITLKYLKNYIERTGSPVNSIYTIGSSKYGLKFEPSSLKFRILKSHFPDIEHYFNLSDLTIAQVDYMLRFRSLDNFHYYVFKKNAELLLSKY